MNDVVVRIQKSPQSKPKVIRYKGANKPDKKWLKCSPRKHQKFAARLDDTAAAEHSISILQHQISSVLNKRNTVGSVRLKNVNEKQHQKRLCANQ
ncbi:hypothetical protein TNCV_3609411 [Trichonephila clavipes]|nr:hypothetical protein TNCV_3609411 [Trichonephila clavipes]